MPRAYPAQVNRPFRGNQRFFSLCAPRFSPRINQSVRLALRKLFFASASWMFSLRNWGWREVFDFARFREKDKKKNSGDER
jgi:hypothetical protein